MRTGFRIGIDLLGGDEDPSHLFAAVIEMQKLNPSHSFIVIALEEHRSLFTHTPITFISAEDAVSMEDSPLYVVRKKKNSSMAIGINLIKSKELDAFVSTGNTGALVAFSSLNLQPLPTIEKPALLATLPTAKGSVAVLDVGAQVSFTSNQLLDYAKMGSFYRTALHGIEEPKIGLLNIGTEVLKGTKEMKEAHFALQECFQKQFIGNIEGRDVFHGKVDVLVTDGFTGNVFLKTCEGASSFLLEYLAQVFPSTDSMKGLLKDFHNKFNYAEHPGAVLCGVDGVIVKCHGYSNVKALTSGIKGAIDLVDRNVIAQLKAKLS